MARPRRRNFESNSASRDRHPHPHLPLRHFLSLVRERMEVKVELSFRNKIARFLKTSSHWFAQFRRRDAHTRFGCISPRLVIQSSATRSTDQTRSSISNLSKPVGPRSLNVNY